MSITQQAKNNKQTKQNAYTYKGNKAVIFFLSTLKESDSYSFWHVHKLIKHRTYFNKPLLTVIEKLSQKKRMNCWPLSPGRGCQVLSTQVLSPFLRVSSHCSSC